MEYKVVRSKVSTGLFEKNIDSLQNIQEQVNKLIQEGWKPQGGIWSSSTAVGYLQAMIREEQP